MVFSLVASVFSKSSSHLLRIKNFAMGQMVHWTGLCIAVASPGHGQEQRAHARHSLCCHVPEHAPNLKCNGSTCGSVLALGSASCTDWSCGFAWKSQLTLFKAQEAPSWPSHTTPPCLRYSVDRYWSRAEGISYFWGRACCRCCCSR